MNTTVKSIPAGKIQPKGFLQTSVGKKIAIAVTGILLVGFVLGHMLGHLQMFVGSDRYNAYAKTLQDLGPVLWLIRIGLLVIFLMHVKLAIQVTLENKAARPIQYYVNKTQKASLASRTMIASGIVILAFVVYHLLHFTFKVTHPEYKTLVDTQNRPDVYKMMIDSFHNPVLVITYLLAVFLLSFHLSHGVFSVLQTLGFNSPKIDSKVKAVSVGFSVFLFLGYACVPIAIFFNVIQ